MPGMKRRMVPGMMAKKGTEMYGKGKEKMQNKGSNKGAEALMAKLAAMGITPAAKMGNGEKLLQKSMGMGGPLDMTVVAENSMRYGGGFMPEDVTQMRYGGATTYSGSSKSKKKRKKRRKK